MISHIRAIAPRPVDAWRIELRGIGWQWSPHGRPVIKCLTMSCDLRDGSATDGLQVRSEHDAVVAAIADELMPGRLLRWLVGSPTAAADGATKLYNVFSSGGISDAARDDRTELAADLPKALHWTTCPVLVGEEPLSFRYIQTGHGQVGFAKSGEVLYSMKSAFHPLCELAYEVVPIAAVKSLPGAEELDRVASFRLSES